MRLLLAEDEADLAEALGVFFEKNHFSVDIVHDGRTACEYAESSVYDVIILDVMMPYMDGFTALRRMRADGNKTPIMMLTARGETRDRIEGFDSGADDYLPKPFDPDELLVRVRREFQLMELLMRSPGMLFSAEYLMEKVWGWDSEAEINVIWVNISNLRKKIRALGSHTQISASRGLGYLLEAGA